MWVKLVSKAEYEMSDNLIFDMCKAVGEFKILTSDRCIWNKKLPGRWPSVLREEPGF